MIIPIIQRAIIIDNCIITQSASIIRVTPLSMFKKQNRMTKEEFSQVRTKTWGSRQKDNMMISKIISISNENFLNKIFK